MIEKEINKNPEGKRQMRAGGLFSTKERKVIPGPRYATSGNVRMATNGRTYRIPNPYGATQIMFYGIAINAPSPTIRVDVFGVAQLKPSYYFEPLDESSVAVAGEVQKIIQSGKWMLITTGAAPQFRARAIETTLTNIDWPTTNDIVCRVEIIDYGPDYFDVEVELDGTWEISGNFLCT